MTNVILETSQGEIEIELFSRLAPKACENFVGLVKKGYYDGVVFHKVIKNLLIQTGDPTGTGRGGESIWGKPFRDEVTPGIGFNRHGLVAMANTGPDTNGSQFFITTGPAKWLNMKHTIFGEVVSGYDVVRRIESMPTDSADRPLSEQKIIKTYLKYSG